jgi:hypothetical protein
VVKRNHGIAYTSSTEPQPERNERRTVPMDLMLPGIRIVPKNRRTTLDKMSRVDFSRMYTVEHNVKVVDIGNVHPSHLGRLQSQWIHVITGGATAGQVTGRLTELASRKEGTEGTESDDDIDDDEKEEEEKGQDAHLPDFASRPFQYRRGKAIGQLSRFDALLHQDTHSQAAPKERPTQLEDYNPANQGTASLGQPVTVTPSAEMLQLSEEIGTQTFMESER